MDAQRGLLRALSRSVSWPPGKPLVSRHEDFLSSEMRCEPGTPCRYCGAYALASYEDVAERERGNWRVLCNVRGAVAGWGSAVHLCSHGWRAGKAYPLALLDWVSEPAAFGPVGVYWHTVLELIAERYEIPILPDVEQLERYALTLARPLSDF